MKSKKEGPGAKSLLLLLAGHFLERAIKIFWVFGSADFARRFDKTRVAFRVSEFRALSALNGFGHDAL